VRKASCEPSEGESIGEVMKILQVVPELRRGGGEKLALQLHNGLLDRGVDSHLAILSGDVVGVRNAITFGANHPKSILVLPRIKKYIHELSPDYVHTHMSPSQTLLAACPIPTKSRLVTTEHSTSNKRRSLPGGRIFDKWLFSRCHRIFCISDAVRESLGRWVPSLKPRLTVVPNGVDLKEIQYSEFAHLPLAFVSVGRLEYVKNFETAIVALSHCVGKFEFSYTIFGEGSLRSQLEATAHSQGLGSRMQFRGWSDQISTELHKFNALLVPSLWEGFGLVAVEAMSAGVPVFCSDTPGLSEVVGADSRFIFPAKDSEALAARLINFNRLSINEHLGLRRAAKEASKKYDINKTIEGYIAEYASI
jgi:glycosyltransferase involved in cell wall biosynthesis